MSFVAEMTLEPHFPGQIGSTSTIPGNCLLELLRTLRDLWRYMIGEFDLMFLGVDLVRQWILLYFIPKCTPWLS